MLYLLLLLFTACTTNQDHPGGHPITRSSRSKDYDFAETVKNPPPSYPWTKPYPPPITKHYFRCKGCSAPPYTHDGETIKDCGGFLKHSLPVKEKEEFIYPILISLLNHLQEQTGKKVIITSGHRCPKHNTYVDPSFENQTSKHLLGAEVSFYIPDTDPLAVVALLQDYYKESEYAAFKRYEGKTNVSTPPWMNKEILIKLFLPHEGRNGDNRHTFPYLSIQVRLDRQTGEPVTYSWAKANRGFYQK